MVTALRVKNWAFIVFDQSTKQMLILFLGSLENLVYSAFV